MAVLDAQLSAGQWLRAARVVGAVTALSLHESRAKVPSVQVAPDQFSTETH